MTKTVGLRDKHIVAKNYPLKYTTGVFYWRQYNFGCANDLRKDKDIDSKKSKQ